MNYEQIEIGQSAEIRHKISAKDIEAFVSLSGDDNRLHTDQSYAAKTSFKKPVAHGMISASFISTLIGTKLPGDGALWYEQNLEFLLPVRIGDEITVYAEVIKKNDRLKAIELKTEIYNQHKQKVVNGIAKVKLIEQSSLTEVEEAANADNTVLVVGATGGIGMSLAKKLAAQKSDLILQYFSNQDKARLLKEELESTYQIRVRTYKADITNQRETDELFQTIKNRVGSVKKIVHAATGPLPIIPIDVLEWNDFTNHLNIHVKGLFNLIKSFLKVFKDVDYANFVAISSQVTDHPAPNLIAYTTAKSAMEGLVKSLAIDLARRGIRLNMVSPGLTDTDLNADWSEKAKMLVAAQTPLRRIARPEDVANAIAFLLSSESDYLTGETIRVNGGLIMK
jgi:3-oxoacyl-[acyl-carrier protein] reductase